MKKVRFRQKKKQSNDTSIVKLFSSKNALVEGGHFVYTSGRHSDVYYNKNALVHPKDKRKTGTKMALLFGKAKPEVIVGVATGSIVFAEWVTWAFNERLHTNCVSVYAEPSHEGDKKVFVLKRGFDLLVKGKRVLIVEDIINTGGSAQGVVLAAKKAGAKVIGVVALCNRGGVTAKMLGVPLLRTCISVNIKTYPEDDCPLCKQKIPIRTDLGKGQSFLKKHLPTRKQHTVRL